MTFGEYPLVGPTDDRDLHFSAKKTLASGVNPMAERKLSLRHAEILMNRLDADVFLAIGHLPINYGQMCHIRDIMLAVESEVSRASAGEAAREKYPSRIRDQAEKEIKIRSSRLTAYLLINARLNGLFIN
jgi:hypothetical protein